MSNERYQVIRTHTSPYQHMNFLMQEKLTIESIEGLTYETLESSAKARTILITNTHTRLRELPSSILEQTELIIHPNSGYDHFEEDQKLWRKIPVIIGHTIRAQAVAEYSLGALFEGLLDLPQHISWHQERTWKRTLLQGTSVWIFGYGHIGKIIANTLGALGMKVTIVDPYINECPYTHLQNWQDGPLEKARVIIAATSLNASSKLIFGKNFFQSLGNEVLFINGARGRLVDENALKGYLQSHPLSFAFLDVFENEPFGPEWQGFPQVWKTSHIAGVESELDRKILSFEETVLRDFLKIDRSLFFKKYEQELLQNKWKQGVLI